MNYEALHRTEVKEFRHWLRFVLVLASCTIVACFFTVASSAGQSHATAPRSVITLDPPTGWDLQVHAFDAQGNALPEGPANFRRLGEVKEGEPGDLHTLTLRFSETVTVDHIKSTPDFRIEQGGTCAEDSVFQANTTCTLFVRFTPQGPGRRLGRVLITHSGSGSNPVPFVVSGFSYQPVISFIPSTITTVPGTYPSNVGLLNGAQNLAIDGGDTLYIADTGNDLIRMLDSSGTFTTLATPSAAPWGVAADSFGEVWFSVPSLNSIFEIYSYGPIVKATGTGTDPCKVATPCAFLSTESVSNPGTININANDTMIFEEETSGAALSQIHPEPATLIRMYDPFSYQTTTPAGFGVDANDTLYSVWTTAGVCQISTQTLYYAEQFSAAWSKVAGGRLCGYSGDGGLADNAEISKQIGQLTFDQANDLYLVDSGNQRVRRVDFTSHIIRTIAGTGTAGYTGDGGRATSATLNNPTGVSVDSQGNVYIISSAATGQVIRKVGSPGLIAFPNQNKGTTSAGQFVTVTNTGNSTMTLTNVAITGANAADFKVDNTTTTCMLTAGAYLYSGATCRIGVIFTPAAAGARAATLTLLDNTVNGADSVTLSGTGVLLAPTFKITAPANGSSFKSGTAVTFSVSVTGSGPKPTGTVQFKVDGTNYGTPVTVSTTGTASTSVTGLSTGTHTLSATYSGDANYAAAGPISVTITITAAAIVKFTTPLSATLLNSSTSVTLAVAVTSKTGPAPTGKVSFSVDGKAVGTATIVSEKASMNAGTLAAGTHTVAAAYSGDKYHTAAKATEKITVSP
jgi:hypothetical protein